VTCYGLIQRKRRLRFVAENMFFRGRWSFESKKSDRKYLFNGNDW